VIANVGSFNLLFVAAIALGAIALIAFVMTQEGFSRRLRDLDLPSFNSPEASRKTTSEDNRQRLRQIVEQGLGSRISGTSFADQMTAKLQHAGIQATAAEWVSMVLVTGLVLSALLAFRFGTLIMAVIALVITYVASNIFLNVRASRLRAKFDQQLAPVVLSLANALRSGSSFIQALSSTAEVSPAPLGPELALIVRKAQFNVPIHDSLMDLASRVRSGDVEILAQSVEISRVTGGDLAGVLERIAEDIRERTKISQTVRTLTAQGRASAWVVSCIPFALGGILALISPSYFSPMLTVGAGQAILAFAFFMIMIGIGIIRRIVRIEV